MSLISERSVKLHEAGQCVIIAADELDLERTLELARAIGPAVYAIKVHHLVDRHGPEVVRWLKEHGARRVWVDAKIPDIPNTVAKRVQAITAAGANFITVMASAEVDAMVAAIAARAQYFAQAASEGALDVSVAAADGAGGSGIVAVTVLTSLDEEQAHLLYGQPARAAVLYQARLAKLAGVKHVVCSPRELDLLVKRRELEGMDFFVPGIRPAGKAAGDQKRFDTPTAAIKAGRGRVRLVIGRAITEASDPATAVFDICEEVATAVAERREAQ